MDFIGSLKSFQSGSGARFRQNESISWEGDDCADPGDPQADLFEQEMDAELESRAHKAEVESGLARSNSFHEPLAGTSNSSEQEGQTGEPERTFYDKIYFDSDEDEANEDEAGVDRIRKKREVKTDDDLMYDPNMDDDDQAWVDNIRKQYQTKTKGKSSKKNPSSHQTLTSNTDAVLNCPACFAVLCLDCQRHDLYKHPYRAMFVMNCSVNHDETLTFPKIKKSKQKKKFHSDGDDANEIFNSVKCVKCSTQVAVFDKDEVYHFFNVVASHS